jgi:hypothetical protein
MTDLMEQLRDARPTDHELDRVWPAHDRTRVLNRIIADAATERPRRRTAWLAAAAVAGTIVVMPSVVGSEDAAAQAVLRDLAIAAVSADGPIIAEGTYLHVTTEATQHNGRMLGDGRTLETNREQWIRWDGTIWAVDSRPAEGWQEFHVFPRTEKPSLNNPTPEFAAALPDDSAQLREYLDEHVSGSNSPEEAIFVAVTDLAASHFLTPQTLAAAIEVLADVDGVETRDVTAFGRPAVEVTYSRFWGGILGRESVVLDRATARVISEYESDPGGKYEFTTTSVEVVDEIPPAVRSTFEQSENGERVHDKASAMR